MSDWRTTETFLTYSNAQRSAFAVGLAIAALGNRKDGGQTYASLDRIAKVARVDRKTANQAIRELEAMGELEYVPGTSRYNRSTYRIRVEVLRDRGVDRFRCPLTMDDTPTVTMDERPMVTMDETPTVTMENFAADYGRVAHATMDETPTQPWASGPRYIDTDLLNRSLDQMSDQSARERAPTDDASIDAGVEQKQSTAVALKTALENCRRTAHRSAGEAPTEPNPTPHSPLADAHSSDDYWQRRTETEASTADPEAIR